MSIPRYIKMLTCPSLESKRGTPPVDLLVLLGGGSSKTQGGISGGDYPLFFLGGLCCCLPCITLMTRRRT
jgi:hypothetical protein